MRVAVICRDKPGALTVRIENFAAHVAYLQASGVVEQAGPLLDAAGQMCGSLLIIGMESVAEAEAWVQVDPYALAGLFESVIICEWNRVIG